MALPCCRLRTASQIATSARAVQCAHLGSGCKRIAHAYPSPRARRHSTHTGAEDPYLWFEEGSGFHAVLHRNGCKDGVGCDPSVSGQHAYSLDGKAWHLSAADAYNATVHYTDGTTEVLKSRERPHLILDPSSGKPTHLVTGANCNRPASPGRTITHIQPIK